jgi:hypothetical protein
VKFVPRHTQIIGRIIVKRPKSSIVRPDESKVSKFVLVDAVGDEARAQGIKVGDIVVPNALGNIVINEGESYRPILEEKHVVFIVTDVSLDEFLVQTDNANQYVPFNSPDAAEPLGDRGGTQTEAA